jgi:CheY-like chemotaxis protein
MTHTNGETQPSSTALSRGTQTPFELVPQRAASRAPSQCVRILVVDDDRDTAAMMSTLLRMAGHEVEAAHDGVGALQSAMRFQPDVVLLDLGLPGVDGFEIARRLRSMPGGEKLLLIALTGYSNAEHVAAARAAGFDHHLSKPVDLKVVRRLVIETADSV